MKKKPRQKAWLVKERWQLKRSVFIFRSQVSLDFLAQGVGEKISISKNPDVPIMMVFQPIWIILVYLYVVMVLIPMNKRPGSNISVRLSYSQ
jgi:hypothetical protein